MTAPRRPSLEGRALHVHMARVFLAQARASRRHVGWHCTLLAWAAHRRKLAQGMTEIIGKTLSDTD